MSPTKRGRFYFMRITLPGFGRVGYWHTGQATLAGYRKVEAWIREQAVTRPEVVRLIVEGETTLRDAWVAHLEGRTDALVSESRDPLLSEAVAAYRAVCPDGRVRSGLAQIDTYAPKGVRLSWLAGQHIQQLYRSAQSDPDQPRKPNTVRRTLYRAVCELLSAHYGEMGRRVRMAETRAPSEDDTRDVIVTADEIRKLIEACPIVLRRMVAVAMLTAVDQGPLLRLRVRHFVDGDVPTLWVPDRKAKARRRKLILSAPAAAYMRASVAGKQPSDPVFEFETRWQVRKAWEAARTAAGRPDLRFKDLRHLLPTTLADLGVDRKVIQQVMGHAAGSKQTDRYITAAGTVEIMEKAADAMGIRHLGVA